MRLSLKLNLALLVVLGVVLGVQAKARLDRESALFEQDMLSDHQVFGRGVRHAVEDEWDDSGREAALALVTRLDAREAGMSLSYEAQHAGGEVASVWDHDEPPGSLTTTLPLARGGALVIRESLQAQQRYVTATARRQLVYLALLVAATWAVVASLMRWLVGQPIERLIAHARRVAAGDLDARVGAGSRDELGQLGLELDQMTEALQAATVARERALEQLRHADRLMTVGKLAAGVAHELGTPLNVAWARARMVATWDVDDVEDARANAHTIAEQCERMTRIIRQLLDFARPRRLAQAPDDLREVAAATLSLMGPIARKKGVTLELDDGPSVPAEIDRNQLEQVLLNLLGNAIAATAEGGRVTIRADSVTVRPPAGSGLSRGAYARLEVADTGTGIAPAHLPHVFEPFFTTKDVGQGTGLGLSVSHGIVRDHGGWIEVDSVPGEGARFSVYVPPGDACADASSSSMTIAS